MAQLSKELRETHSFLMKHDSRREKTPVVHKYALPAFYNPEEIADVRMAAICSQKRWWPIPDTIHYGMTDDPSLTVNDPDGQPCPILLREAQIPDTVIQAIISGLQQMRSL